MLRERLRAIIEGLKILCPHLQKYDGILRENLKKFEEAVGKGVDKFLGEMETLTNPEAIRDLKELKETINSVIDLKQWKEPMRKELENLETAIYRLQTLAAVREPPPPIAIMAIALALDPQEVLREYEERAKGLGQR